MVSDCEEAARRLPVTYTGDDVVVGKSKIGRACGLAANALKARTLLYAASPAYQDKDVIQINGMGNFTVLNEATYQAGWERAALFANEVLKDAGINYTFTAMAAKDLADAGSDTRPILFSAPTWDLYMVWKADTILLFIWEMHKQFLPII